MSVNDKQHDSFIPTTPNISPLRPMTLQDDSCQWKVIATPMQHTPPSIEWQRALKLGSGTVRTGDVCSVPVATIAATAIHASSL
eukprot:scaffold134404_cov66-Attheya_sp.AAC.1